MGKNIDRAPIRLMRNLRSSRIGWKEFASIYEVLKLQPLVFSFLIELERGLKKLPLHAFSVTFKSQTQQTESSARLLRRLHN